MKKLISIIYGLRFLVVAFRLVLFRIWEDRVRAFAFLIGISASLGQEQTSPRVIIYVHDNSSPINY